MKKKYCLITVAILTLCTFVSIAQTPIYKEATLQRPAELWEPVNLSDNESNVLKGVKFYSHNSDCNTGKVTLVKLINLNSYQVKINYQINPKSPIIDLVIPPATSIEGSCSATNENLLKLVLTLPESKIEAENKEMKKFLLSHITVSKQ
ncbi:MAG: hypothetical protein H7141_11485 [Burkholderiales bacterium]|nr:hypothetical protein [Bacteroidia bacterium]